MTIKYANLFIIINLDEFIIPKSIWNYLGFEYISKESSMVIEFDDNTIYDVNEYDNKHTFIFGTNVHGKDLPLYFQVCKTSKTLFYKNSVEVDDKLKLNFDNLFKNFTKLKEPSIYNMIYYVIDSKYNNRVEKESFSILHIKSNKDKPQFIIAYDDEIFDKTKLITLVYYIFKNKSEKL